MLILIKNFANREKTQLEQISIFKKLAKGIKEYLSDWRNLLAHALLGIVFILIAIWMPINIWLKLIIIAILVLLNILRMQYKKQKVVE